MFLHSAAELIELSETDSKDCEDSGSLVVDTDKLHEDAGSKKESDSGGRPCVQIHDVQVQQELRE